MSDPAPAVNMTQVTMIRPHLKDIPDAPFPEGYGCRPMSLEDIGLWTDIERDAEPILKIKDETFRKEFGQDLAAVPQRCYIVTDPRGLGVGTVSAWYDRNFRGREYGRIHWVAIRPSCQGKGLGKSALAFALHRLAQWHDRCYLSTSTERTGAICLYLNFGFMPDLDRPNAREIWGKFSQRVKHPALDEALARA